MEQSQGCVGFREVRNKEALRSGSRHKILPIISSSELAPNSYMITTRAILRQSHIDSPRVPRLVDGCLIDYEASRIEQIGASFSNQLKLF